MWYQRKASYFKDFVLRDFVAKNEVERQVQDYLIRNASSITPTGRSWKSGEEVMIGKSDLTVDEIESYTEMWREFARSIRATNIDAKCERCKSSILHWWRIGHDPAYVAAIVAKVGGGKKE